MKNIPPDLIENFEAGFLALQAADLDRAQAHFLQVLAIEPDCKEAHYHLGEIKQAQKEFEQAIQHYEKVLELDPSIQEVYNNLGSMSSEQGQFEMAIDFFFKALSLNPDFVLAHHNIGLLFCRQGQYELGLTHFTQALSGDPELAQTYYQYGLAFLQAKYYPGAQVYFKALIQADGELLKPALLRLAFCYFQELEHTLALSTLDEYAERFPDDDLPKLLKALYQPLFYENQEDIQTWQDRLKKELGKIESPLQLPQLANWDLLHFPSAYQKDHPKAELENLARLLRPSLPESLAPLKTAKPGSPIRMGIVSRFFYEHPVALSYLNILKSFPRRGYEIIAFALPGSPRDGTTDLFEAQVLEFVALPDQLAQAYQVLGAADLDLLLYTDLGMDPYGYCLAMTRMAPVQALLSGHPMTSGLPSIDYFISSVPLELPFEQAQAHYTESLILLPETNVNLPAFTLPSEKTGLDVWGIPEDGHRYICPLTTLKLHPQMDMMFESILSRDPLAQIILFRDASPVLFLALQKRLKQHISAEHIQRVHFLPWLSGSEFLSVLSQMHVMLDGVPFGAGTTAYYAFSVGLPIVTWPLEHLKGRVVSGLYQQMNIQECIAHSQDDYIELAIKLASNEVFNQGVRAKIKSSAGLIFNRSQGIENMVVQLTDKVNQYRRKIQGATHEPKV